MIYIDDLVGVRYRPNGRDKNGYDCYGLAIEVCKRLGRNLVDVIEMWKKTHDFLSCENECLKTAKLIQCDEPTKEGDIILIKNTKGIMSHIGVYLGNKMFIHCNRYGVHLDKIERYKHLIGRVYTWQ